MPLAQTSLRQILWVYGLVCAAVFALTRLEPLAADDLIELDDAGVSITQKGRLLLRSIAMIFDRYIDQAENDNRFSKAI